MNTEKIQKHWSKQTALIHQINEAGGFVSYINSQTNRAEIWRLPNRAIGCIDEGCSMTGYHLAGSGILLGVEKTAELLENSGVAEITSHDGCGAAGLYAKRENLDPAKSDNYGIVFAQKLAEMTGLKYRHIKAEEMSRPPEGHIARLAVYDGSGVFNPTAIPDWPACFWISRYLNPDAKEEAAISVKIALGDHGYGNLITPEEPFHILVVGHNSNPATSEQVLVNELKSVFDQPDRVAIVSLTAPK